MLRHCTLLVCSFGIASLAHAQSCLPDGLFLITQAQVNSFPNDHPGCTTIEGLIRIGQGNITNLAPLSQITTVNGYLHIGPNPQLTGLAGLDNITSVGGSLTILGNAQLNDLSALAGITTVGGLMEISENNSLTSLVGLHGITTVGSYLEISESPGLTDLQGLEGMETIGGSILINENPVLATMQGLSPSSVGGSFSLMNNPQLMDLSAASGLTSLGGVLSLIGNTSILSLQELSGITAVNALVRVMGSSGLMSLAGLENIDPTTMLNLIIANNPGLFQCAVESLCDYLAIPGSMANITGNATGCADRDEVEAGCALLSMDDPLAGVGGSFSMFPNPSSGRVTFRGMHGTRTEIRVVDATGRVVHADQLVSTGAEEHVMGLGHLVPGTYLVHVRSEHASDVRALIRE